MQSYSTRLHFVIIYWEEWKGYWLNLLNHKASAALFTASTWILKTTLGSRHCNLEAMSCVYKLILYTIWRKSHTPKSWAFIWHPNFLETKNPNSQNEVIIFWLFYETFTLCQPFKGHFLFFSMKPSCLSGFWTLVWPIFRPSMISQLSGSWWKIMKTHWFINCAHTRWKIALICSTNSPVQDKE